MSEEIEPKPRPVPRALRTAMKAFSHQARALNRIFRETVRDAAPGEMRFHAQYRATLKILLALEEESRAGEKSRNSSKRTIEDGNSAA
jgi:hypothetical protein